MDEENLIQLKNGNTDAFDYFYDQYKIAVYAYCMKLTGRKEDAEDATAFTFSKLWLDRSKLTETAHLKNFLYTVAKRYVYNLTRKYKRTDRFKKGYRMIIDVEQTDAAPYERTFSELIKIIYDEIEQLPTPTREVFLATILKGKKKKEVAEQLDICEKTVYNERIRGLKTIQLALTKHSINSTL